MTVEVATYINQLDASYPAAGDAKSEGDNHLRLIKSTIKATLPNVSGAVTPTHTELNYVDGVTSAIQTQIDAKAPIASPTFTGQVGIGTAPTGSEVLRVAANVAAPSSIDATTISITQGKGDNTTFIGVSGAYLQTRDRSDVTALNKGVLYGLQVSVVPQVARNNIPYDDVGCLVLQNDATVADSKGTDAIYLGRNSAAFPGVHPEWLTGCTFDANADYGYRMAGAYFMAFNASGKLGGYSSTTNYGFAADPEIQTGVTTLAALFNSAPSTVASAFTLTTLSHFRAEKVTIGATSAITTQAGFQVGSGMTGATNNYGFHGQLASGTGVFNLYMSGTANNYIAGSLGLGAQPSSIAKMRMGGSGPLATDSYGTYNDIQFDPASVTNGYAFSTASRSATGTLTSLSHFAAQQGTLTGTVGTQYGFSAMSTLTGASTNYGFYGGIAAAANRWNFYAAGTAQNYFAGCTGIGVAAASTSALTVAASTTAVSSLNIPHGAAPTSPVNGDVWTTTAGLFIRINGVTKTVTLT